MTKTLYIAYETFVLLKRHKIFVPMIVVFACVCFVSTLATGLAPNEFRKVLFDVGIAGLHGAGGLIAIFWGAKAMTDSRQEGSLEVQLASPISRSTWLLGKFLGLVGALVALGLIFCALWQGVMLALGFGWMSGNELAALGFIVLVWTILAGLVIFFSSFCNLPVAVFSCLCAWGLGMSSEFLARGFPPNAPGFTQSLVTGLTRYWNLQRFNLSDALGQPAFPDTANLLWRLGHGVALVGVIMIASMALFKRRDLVR